VRWELEQFHWHTPSEHEIDGRDTPLEMHFVHTRADDAILVIAVLIERGRKNDAIEPMFGDLPDQPDDTREVPDVALRALLPQKRASFRYTGSLTTPPFTEPVRFVVLADSISVSRRQIRAFRELFEDGNSRGAAAKRAQGAKRRKTASTTTTAHGRPARSPLTRSPPAASRTQARRSATVTGDGCSCSRQRAWRASCRPAHSIRQPGSYRTHLRARQGAHTGDSPSVSLMTSLVSAFDSARAPLRSIRAVVA
jgi:Eukaryotic-type carbonic anhydrase